MVKKQATFLNNQQKNALIALLSVTTVFSLLLNFQQHFQLQPQRSSAWNLDDGIAFCSGAKAAWDAAEQAVNNAFGPGTEGVDISIKTAAYQARNEAAANYRDNGCENISHLLQ